MKLWDDITPTTPPSQAQAIIKAEKRRQQKIDENKKVLDEYMACTLPRMMRILDMADAVSERLTQTKLDTVSRKEK